MASILYSTGLLSLALICGAAVVTGTRVHRPSPAAPWYLIAASAGSLGLGRFAYGSAPGTGMVRLQQVGAFALYVTACALLTAALSGFAPSQTRYRDWAVPVDIAVLMLAVGLLAWAAVGRPWWNARAVQVAPLWARLFYVVAGLLVLAAAIRLLFVRMPSASLILLTTGVAGLLAFGTLFVIQRAGGDGLPEAATAVGSGLSYAAVGLAALIPSMRQLTIATAAKRPDGTSVARLALVALPSLIPSVVLVAHPIFPGRDQVIVSVVATVMMVLVLVRLIGGATRLRGQIRMERVARQAAADVAGASDAVGVTAAVDGAVASLLPRHMTGQVSVVPPEPDRTSVPLPAGGAGAAGAAAGGAVPPRNLVPPAEARQRIGALLIDREVRVPASLRPTLETISAQALLALDRMRLNRELVRYESERHFVALVENAADVILIIDDLNRIRYASPSARTLLDRPAIRGTSLLELVDESDRRAAESLLQRVRSSRTGGYGGSADWTIRKTDGGHALTEVTCRDLRSEDSVRGVVVTLRDVTEQRRLEHELTRWAFHDPLTGLPNRRFFDDRVVHAVATGNELGVVAIDLDDFKLVNDGLGHEVGDAILRTTADRLRDTVGGAGFAARRGGDEFAVLLENPTTVDAVNETAVRVCESLAEPVSIDGGLISCSASVGVATTMDPGGRQGLLRHADLALYAAKGAGSGQWRHYEPSMTTAVMHRIEMRSSLGHAVDDDALLLEYQPIVAIETGHTVGFEALLRWRHPTRGLVLPGDFIDVAEEAGLIPQIGSWVLAAATVAAARWGDVAPQSPPYLSVNVSALQFRSPGFVDQVYRLCEASALPPHRLMLEITESLLLRDDEEVWQDLKRLRHWGVRVAIDDFGTGYSALSYLRQVPLDVVKLDRIFTTTMTSSLRQRELVEGIVRLTLALDLEVVAEGVETERERELAAAIGCTYGQGYLFSRPMPEADVPGWLTAGTAPEAR